MISRRAFTAGIAAVPIGITGGLLVRRMISPQATIRFLGRRDSMIACLDGGNERALFLLGATDAGMIPFLPQLLTVGRTRVDLIVASHQWLTTAGIRDELDLAHITTLSLQANSSVPPINGMVTAVTSTQAIGLGDGFVIEIRVEDALGREATDPRILVEISARATRLTLANDESAVNAIKAKPDLLAVPGDVSSDTIERLAPALFVGTALHEDGPGRESQMFYNEPIGVSIRDGSLTIPEGQFSS